MGEALKRLDRVRDSIDRASRNAGREPGSVSLIAVSKTVTTESLLPLLDAGQRDFGENRVQEAARKWPDLKRRYPGIRLHLVGQLQSNKAEEAVELFDTIHSVDRQSLIAALAKATKKSGRQPRFFVQINIGDEAQKGGCEIADLPGLMESARAAGLRVVGLMCVPPAGVEPAPYFALLAKLARRHRVAELSMGMSGDYEVAVMMGATHVRVGTALFGERV